MIAKEELKCVKSHSSCFSLPLCVSPGAVRRAPRLKTVTQPTGIWFHRKKETTQKKFSKQSLQNKVPFKQKQLKPMSQPHTHRRKTKPFPLSKLRKKVKIIRPRNRLLTFLKTAHRIPSLLKQNRLILNRANRLKRLLPNLGHQNRSRAILRIRLLLKPSLSKAFP